MRLRFEEEQKKERRIKLLKETLLYFVEIALVILIAWLIVRFAMKPASMIGSTMEPTLYNGEDVIINKTSYAVLTPKRHAVIAFYPEQKEGDETVFDDSSILIRRVLGLPGETVQITGGRILINGEVYNEGKDFPMITNPGLAATAVTLESGEYFVLGDNRNNSEDSRYADIGMVRKRYIVGKIWFTCSPFEKLGFTKG